MEYSFAYIKMLLALGAIVAFLFWLKSYLIKKNFIDIKKNEDIKIIAQKPLDSKNRVTIIKYKNKEYLLLVGESGYLIDKFDTFDKVLKENKS